LPTAASPRQWQGASTRRAWACPTSCPTTNVRETTPELAARYPLAMISPPARHFLNSTFVNVKSLRAIEGEPLLEIHPDDAAARGIAAARWCGVQRPRPLPLQGRGERPRAARRGQRPGRVVAQAGLDGTNVNELTHQRSPTSAGAHLLRLPGRGGRRCAQRALIVAGARRLRDRAAGVAAAAWAAAAARWATTARRWPGHLDLMRARPAGGRLAGRPATPAAARAAAADASSHARLRGRPS
jgi:hypothetical protein